MCTIWDLRNIHSESRNIHSASRNIHSDSRNIHSESFRVEEHSFRLEEHSFRVEEHSFWVLWHERGGGMREVVVWERRLRGCWASKHRTRGMWKWLCMFAIHYNFFKKENNYNWKQDWRHFWKGAISAPLDIPRGMRKWLCIFAIHYTFVKNKIITIGNKTGAISEMGTGHTSRYMKMTLYVRYSLQLFKLNNSYWKQHWRHFRNGHGTYLKVCEKDFSYLILITSFWRWKKDDYYNSNHHSRHFWREHGARGMRKCLFHIYRSLFHFQKSLFNPVRKRLCHIYRSFFNSVQLLCNNKTT